MFKQEYFLGDPLNSETTKNVYTCDVNQTFLIYHVFGLLIKFTKDFRLVSKGFEKENFYQ